MEKYSPERANDEAMEIQKRAEQLKEKQGESGNPKLLIIRMQKNHWKARLIMHPSGIRFILEITMKFLGISKKHLSGFRKLSSLAG
jgi:hypothetical protein